MCFLPCLSVCLWGRWGTQEEAGRGCRGRASGKKAKANPLAKFGFMIIGVLGVTTMKRRCHGNHCKRLSISRKPDCERMLGNRRIKLM